MSEREVWVMERKTSSGEWIHFANAADQEDAEEGVEMAKTTHPRFEFRVVRYVPEVGT